jgi:hypothetical protein
VAVAAAGRSTASYTTSRDTTDEGEARSHTPELDLVLEVIGHECAAMVVTECKTDNVQNLSHFRE